MADQRSKNSKLFKIKNIVVFCIKF